METDGGIGLARLGDDHVVLNFRGYVGQVGEHANVLCIPNPVMLPTMKPPACSVWIQRTQASAGEAWEYLESNRP